MGSKSDTPQVIVPLSQLDHRSVRLAGGKAANLGEMLRSGFPVPPGFCVTTGAYAVAASGAAVDRVVTELGEVPAEDSERLVSLAARVRQALLGASLHESVVAAVSAAYAELGP